MPGRILIINMTNNKNKKTSSPLIDLVPLITGEAVVVALVCIGFIVVHFLGFYTLRLSSVFGALLGAAVILINHGVLVFSVDKQINRFIENRPTGEMSDEEITLYAKKQSVSIQNAMKTSFALRTVSMLATLVVAFLIPNLFNPIAAAIPMFALRPLISLVDRQMRKHDKTPDPSKFIKYDDEEDKKEEKEDK